MLFVRARAEPRGNREALFVAWPRTSRITASRRQRAIRLVDPAVGGDEKLKIDKIRDTHRRRCFCHLPVCLTTLSYPTKPKFRIGRNLSARSFIVRDDRSALEVVEDFRGIELNISHSPKLPNNQLRSRWVAGNRDDARVLRPGARGEGHINIAAKRSADQLLDTELMTLANTGEPNAG
jgi:hypothetical protein